MPEKLPPSPSDDNKPKPTDKKPVEHRVLVGVIVAAAVVVAVMLVLAVLAIGFPWDGFWQVAAQPFATVLGGLAVLCGGALALYNGRETRDHDKRLAEQENNRVTALAATDHERETVKELNARFSAAAIQLGDDKSAIRLAGAYSMAALADDWHRHGNAEKKQTCIDVLCSYLRARPTTVRISTSIGAKLTDEEDDLEVRQTIQRLIADHLRAETPVSWSSSRFNFASAQFIDLDFSLCHFEAAVTFDNAQFRGQQVSFHETRFSGPVSFKDARLDVTDFIYFAGCKFIENWRTDFTNARFSAQQIIDFQFAEFSCAYTSFFNSTFHSREISFSSCIFSSSSTTTFVNATFRANELDFSSARFLKGRTHFGGARFDLNKSGMFTDAEFASTVDFGQPVTWDDMKMVFDWSFVPEDKPQTVRPIAWPPTPKPD